jgi:hypothetical protein
MFIYLSICSLQGFLISTAGLLLTSEDTTSTLGKVNAGMIYVIFTAGYISIFTGYIAM